DQITPDRYSYLPCLGWALLVGAGMGALLRRARAEGRRGVLRWIGAGVIVLWIGALAFQTWQQLQIWRTTDTLWQRALDVDPACAIYRSYLAASLRGDRAALPGRRASSGSTHGLRAPRARLRARRVPGPGDRRVPARARAAPARRRGPGRPGGRPDQDRATGRGAGRAPPGAGRRPAVL